MTTLLQINLEDDGSVSAYLDPTHTLTERQRAAAYPYLQDFDPSLRRRAAPYEGPHPELARELMAWRREKSRELGVSAYIILTQKVLYAIADKIPQTEGELLNISGFGPVLFEKYGLDILRITCCQPWDSSES